MEFDASRVYTALNADELKIGSECIFADMMEELRLSVQYAYLIKPPAEISFIINLSEEQ